MKKDVGTEWRANSRKQNTPAHHDTAQAHRALYERIDTTIRTGIAAMQRAVADQELKLKLQLRQQMERQSPSITREKLEDHAEEIARSAEIFQAQAGDLSSFELTLARAAAFVSPEGTLAQLVVLSLHTLSTLHALSVLSLSSL